MKVVHINSYNHGSTGKIMLGIAEQSRKSNIQSITCCPSARSMKKYSIPNHIYIGTRVGRNIHIALSRITGFNGCFSIIDTLLFLKKIDKYNPDIVHIHNLHNSYINIPLLFKYLKKRDKKVVWTLHDCWSFTGHCTHFSLKKCNKWKTGCYNCTSYKEYPQSIFDNSKCMWKLKNKWFNSINQMVLVTPSNWLKGLVETSFLQKYPVKTINNGINTEIFRKTVNKDLVDKKTKYIILGVSFSWSYKKGLDVFIQLAERLGLEYKIVLVGVDEEQKKFLPSNIDAIDNISDQNVLAEIYSSADVFVNPTREEVLGLVNVEALACETPVITFNAGGAPECVNELSGVVVNVDDVDELVKQIEYVCKQKPFLNKNCREKALLFSENRKYKEYIDIYNSLYRGSLENMIQK